MERAVLEKLRRGGAVVPMQSGEAVRVTLQVPDIPSVPRNERRELLLRLFQELQDELAGDGVVVDTASMSVSGQTAEALIPLGTYDHVLAAAAGRDVRVDPLVERHVL